MAEAKSSLAGWLNQLTNEKFAYPHAQVLRAKLKLDFDFCCCFTFFFFVGVAAAIQSAFNCAISQHICCFVLSVQVCVCV